MMNQEQKRPVTIEDLLRLKRAERPPAEFWSQFDRALRAKQLAAIVEKRPWWRTVPRVFGSLSRYHLPLGATAILALSVLTVREYRSPVAGAAVPDAGSVALSSPFGPESQPETKEVLHSLPAGHDLLATVVNEPTNDPATGSPDSESVTVGRLSQIIPVLGAAHIEPEPTPTARFIATNLALAKAAEPAITQNLLGASYGFETRAMPSRAAVVEPLAQMASPSDVRRSRLLNGAAMSVSMNSPVPARSAEIRSRRISDDQLYDTISRFGAKGNSLLVKF